MNIAEGWSRWVDLIYPRACALCRTGLSGPGPRRVCAPCEGRLDLIGSAACRRCGAWTGGEEESCPECAGKRFRFRRAVAVGRYAGDFRELILRFKYHRAAHLAPYFGRLLAEKIRETALAGSIDAVVPVPMGRWKAFWRGYNQAELLADHAARDLGKPLIRGKLIKIRKTSPQSQLHLDQRLTNLRGAFSVRPGNPLQSRTVLLVDDILTTGSTANECANALHAAGARDVYVAVLGR